MLRLLFALTSLVLLPGCTTFRSNAHSVVISDVDWPLTELRGLCISLLPTGQRAMSPNGREILSNHFTIVKNKMMPASYAESRYYMRFIILGDRRPYDIEVMATEEKRVLRGDEFIYVNVGGNRKLAEQFEQKIRAELTKRREDRNIIDDFRVY